jgi:hypothetical protein
MPTLKTTSWIYRTFGRADASPGVSAGGIFASACLMVTLVTFCVAAVTMMLFLVGALLQGERTVEGHSLDRIVSFILTGLAGATCVAAVVWIIKKTLGKVKIVDGRTPEQIQAAEEAMSEE